MQEAAANFSTMVSSSTVSAFHLELAFGENATNANSKLTEVFDFINSGKSSVSQMIETLNQELQIRSIICQITYSSLKIQSAILC